MNLRGLSAGGHPLTARDHSTSLEKFYVQDFVRTKLQNDPELRTALLYQEDQIIKD